MIWIYDYDNVSFNIENNQKQKEIVDVDWSRSGDKNASPLHSISSYLAMFAPAVPKYFINKFTKRGDVVYDPFSGRGTTGLKSREMNRKFIGSDLNPYALVLSRAKVATSSKEDILKSLSKMEKSYSSWLKIKTNINQYKLAKHRELNYFYSPMVLKQLIYLREFYGKKWRNFNNQENILFGIILGLMHGQSRKDGTSIYFSLNMPNTISMAPNYVKKYALEHNLKKPKANVFELIRNRIDKKYDRLLAKKFDSKIYEINALAKGKRIKDGSIQLVVTSPPYLNIVDYTKSNWLKLWLLGYNRQSLQSDIKLSDKFKYGEYINFICTFLNNIYSKIKPNGYLALMVGDVRGEKIIEKIWQQIKEKVAFKLDKIYWDVSYLQSKKTTNMLNKRRGKATLLDKVLLLVKK